LAPSEKLPPRPPRLEYELPVAYQSVSGFITDWAVNISRGGLFINTKKPLSVGTPVKLIVSLPGTKFPFDLTGRVTRINTPHDGANHVPGMAIEFVNVDDAKRTLIEDFVERLRTEMPDEVG
jgi:type IV pilus assembly protein PilZ